MKIDSGMVKKLRIGKNWSQEQLSEVSGLSVRTIQRLESGGNASLESLRALAAAFEVDSNELELQERQKFQKPLDAVQTSLMEFANFSGKAHRFEYWWFFLFMILVMGIAAIMHERVYQVAGVLLLIPFLAVGTRRLNDTGRSGWWQLLLLVPFGQIVVFYLMTQPGSEENDPLQ